MNWWMRKTDILALAWLRDKGGGIPAPLSPLGIAAVDGSDLCKSHLTLRIFAIIKLKTYLKRRFSPQKPRSSNDPEDKNIAIRLFALSVDFST